MKNVPETDLAPLWFTNLWNATQWFLIQENLKSILHSSAASLCQMTVLKGA